MGTTNGLQLFNMQAKNEIVFVMHVAVFPNMTSLSN